MEQPLSKRSGHRREGLADVTEALGREEAREGALGQGHERHVSQWLHRGSERGCVGDEEWLGSGGGSGGDGWDATCSEEGWENGKWTAALG